MSRQTSVESHRGGPERGHPRGENVLVLASSMDAAADQACCHLAGGADNLLVVSLTQSPDSRVRTICADGDRPSRIAAVSCDPTRGASAAADTGTRTGATPTSVTVPSPGDLTGLGMHVERLLSTLAEDGELAVCIHSLTTLLQYSEAREVFRFGHAMTRKVREVGATAHFHLDPSTVDEQTLRTMAALFDRTVEA